MTTLSSSPHRHTFLRDKYIEKRMSDGLMDDPETIAEIKYYEEVRLEKADRERNQDWQKDNLEYDLRTTDWILRKTRESEKYAQNLYAALCNNDFVKNEVWPILQEKIWMCSWRTAGGIIANMREEGDYIDWYCSSYHDCEGYIQEGMVTEEIRSDLLRLGWIIKE